MVSLVPSIHLSEFYRERKLLTLHDILRYVNVRKNTNRTSGRALSEAETRTKIQWMRQFLFYISIIFSQI